MDVVVANAPTGGVASRELEGETVIREEAVILVCGNVLHSATPWCVNTWEDSLISDLSNIIAESKGPEREQRRGRRTRQLTWKDR